MKKLIVVVAIGIVLTVAGFLYWRNDSPVFLIVSPSIQSTETPTTLPAKTISPPQSTTGLILHKVPFTVQAPGGIWADPMFENACEEASILMAMHWVRGTTFTNPRQEIYDLSVWEEKTYGDWYDRSAKDTAQMIKDYFDYDNVEYKEDIHIEDIKEALAAGGVVVVPIDGQKVGNPFYVQPGPIAHMMIVIGYDSKTKEFITNDPGTRRGAGYRYSEQKFIDAVRDYPTGKYQPITEIKRNMIIVFKD